MALWTARSSKYASSTVTYDKHIKWPCIFCSFGLAAVRNEPLKRQRRLLHSSGRLLQAQNHYQVLDLPQTASQADIKKKFYALSKTHHPDRNPTNQAEASKKFVAINDAYAVLGHPDKRAKYDEEVGAQSRSSPSYAGHGGSYSSSQSPAGGRKASGLSRRRSTFRGPPPSFFRNGAWGASGEKRQSAAEKDGRAEWERMKAEQEAAARGESPSRQAWERAANMGGFAGQTGGAWPFNADPNDVPHFNRDQHFQTQSSVEEQLKQGRQKRRQVFDDMVSEGPGAEFRSFLVVSGVLLTGLVGSLAFFKTR